MGNRRVLAIVAGVLVVAGLIALAAGVGQRLVTPEEPPRAASATNLPAGFVEFRYPQAGFALAYPRGWTRLQVADPQVVLLAAQGQQESFLVRVVELNAPVGPADLGAAKQLTDQIVMSNESVQLLAEPQQIELAGLPGYYYSYSFKDAGSGQTGAHSHVFAFNGRKMITLVFQALPIEHYPRVAPTFAQISSTFRVLERK